MPALLLAQCLGCALSTEAAQVIGRAYDGPVDCVKTMVREEGVGGEIFD